MAKCGSIFDSSYYQAEKLEEAARTSLKVALNLKARERVLIMANPDGKIPDIAMAVYNAAMELEACPVLLFQPARSRLDLAEPSTLGAIATEPDVLFTITRESLGNDPNGLRKPYQVGDLTFNHIFYYLIAMGKARGAWCPSADADVFCRTVPIDYPKLWRRAKRLKAIFDAAESIRVETPAGTDLHVDLFDREGLLDDGDYRYSGTGGNLPAGEVFAIPNRRSNGRVIIDGSAAIVGGTLKITDPVELIIEDGKIIAVNGGDEAVEIQKTVEEMRRITEMQIQSGIISEEMAVTYRSNCTNLAEFGIGLNPAATLCGNMTEDEKALDTCHVAMGDDCYGLAPAVDHFDMVMLKPRMTFLMKDGARLEIDPKDPPEL